MKMEIINVNWSQHSMNEGWIRETSGNFDPSGNVIRSWAAGVLDRAF